MPPPARLPLIRLILLTLAASAASAQSSAPWRSPLYPENWSPPTTASFESDKLIQDFSYAGYRRGDVPLPSPTGPTFDVTTFGADPSGNADSTAAIQRAIDAATSAGGGVILLPRGTFKVSPQGTNNYALRLAANNLVLRGAGIGQTFLLNDATSMRSKSIIRIDGSGSGWSTVPAGSPTPAITADLLSPTTSIPVASVAGFDVGDWIVLRADATDAFVAEHNMTDLWAGQSSGLGGVMFLRQITAIDSAANRLTIDVPTRYYLKTRDNARVHRAVPHVEEVGLENFSIANREHPLASSRTGWGEEDYNTATNGSYDTHASYAIALRRARNCWVSHIATFRPAANSLDTHLLSNGILLENCRGVTVRACDFQRPLYGGGGGNGYMYRIQASNECLLRDCAARYGRHNFVFSHMACSGNVIHGGLGQVTATQAAGTGAATAGEGSDHHMHLSQSNLIDGVQLDRDFFTAHYRGTSGTPPQHGHGGTHTVFWNLVGLAYDRTKTYIVRTEQARHGYVIGTRGSASGINAPASARTAPADHTEGAGLGDALQPLSLYHDQLTRRLSAPQPPPVPTAFQARPGITDNRLIWNPSPTATSYRIHRSTTLAGPFTVVGTTATATFTDSRLATGTTYFYRLAAANSAGETLSPFELSATPMPVFTQDIGPQSFVIIEAENADANVAQGGHAWSAAPAALAVGSFGSGALAALPNSGTTRDTGFASTSPRLDYRIEFFRTGTYHVWLRGLGPSGNDDSVHVGLDGAPVATSDRITGFGTSWTWRNTTTDGPIATLEIPTTGIHTLNIWMREDGVLLDRFLLTTDAAFTPTETRFPENHREGTITVPAAPNVPARVVNLATRALVGGNAGTPIAGFVIGGTGAKRMLVRAVGPGLAAFGLTSALPSPSLTVVSSSVVLTSNDRWHAGDTEFFRALGAFALPAGSRDAALVTSLPTGPYSTPVGAAGASGVALLELYDADPANLDATLVNASARAFVGTGDAILIPGFTLAGTGNARLLIRAVGPTLATFGLDGALADPQLTLFRDTTALQSNDNWSSATNAAEIAAAAAQAGAFPLPSGSRDAALLVSLPAGSYTANISGVANTTGTALVEIYVLP